LIGTAVLGGALFLWSILAERRASHQSATAPEWLARAPLKASFQVALTPAKDDRANEAAQRLVDAYSGIARVTSDWRLSRILLRGYLYDSELSLSAHRPPPGRADPVEVVLRVNRPGVAASVYRAELGEHGLLRVEYGLGKEQLQPVALGYDEPLSIGDLRVRDVLDMYYALKARQCRSAGTLEGLNSAPLRVYDVDLGAPSHAATGGDAARRPRTDDPTGAGATALLYCETGDLRPRVIRVFDHGNRLVRIYDDLAFASVPAGDASVRLTSFRVDSIPTYSHSVFRLATLDLARR
jgi:hypothetical protein